MEFWIETMVDSAPSAAAIAIGASAAEGFRGRHAHEAQFAEFEEELRREGVVVLELRGSRAYALAGEGAYGVADAGLLFAQDHVRPPWGA